MNVTDFLFQNVPGYADLEDAERSAISEFSLLWTVFEGKLLRADANPRALVRLVQKLMGQGLLSREPFVAALNYFQNRYFHNGALGPNFPHLRFSSADQVAIVEPVLSGQSDELEQVVTALLLIIYRLRNNLFHGQKWAYGVRDQRNNFEHASDVLMHFLTLGVSN